MKRIRLLLLDDHVLFREGLRRLLISEPDFETVAECGTPAEALEVLARADVDIVLLDFDLDNETGTRFLASALAAGFTGKVLMVTAGMDSLDISVARRLGVSGIFMKHDSPRALLSAIRTVAAGSEWASDKVAAPPLRAGAEMTSKTITGLTPREQQVLRSVFEGLTNKEISHQIGASLSAVKATLQALFEKTGVRTRGQLVRIAIERSLETVRKPS